LARIEQLISEYGVTKIVVGYPKNMDNSIGERARLTEEFAETLKRRTGLEVVLWDERLTTVAATQMLKLGEVKPQDRKAVVDKLAAVLILQGYLDLLSHENKGLI